MRLYKAKKTSDSSWITGYALKVPVPPFVEGQPITYKGLIISSADTDYSALTGLLFDDAAFPKYEVDSTTMLQHLGAYGKNAVEIYEGDIITANIYPFDNFNGIVEFNADIGAYVVRYKKKPTYTGRGIFDGNFIRLDYLAAANIDVIGNIIDDSELT